MRAIIVLITILFLEPIHGQSENDYDFWVGEWECYWLNSNKDTIKGSNSVTKILDGKVIQENFEDPSRNFKGMSVSVFNPQKLTWHQAWVDNQGGYYDFIGINGDSIKLFSTDTSEKHIQRMKFYNIKNKSFTWDWEKSADNGKNYKLVWRILYKRKTN